MKRAFTSIPQLYRNVKRWTEIISILSKYGLADWLGRLNIDWMKDWIRAPDGELVSHQKQSALIRMALTDLGPTFIKFGQLLSTRPDLIGPELAEELSLLQSDAPSDDFSEIRKTVEGEMGKRIEDVFESFDEVPIASASIGQVHRAILRPDMADNGQSREHSDVVVKVRHTNIEPKIETDLDILSGLASLAERLDDFKNYQPTMIVEEISKTLRRELIFDREYRNLVQFRVLFEKEDSVVIPRPIAPYCSTQMLTMERLDGVKLRDAQREPPTGIQLADIAKNGANLYLKMIFQHGFYHADPHPGNILLMENGKLGLIDFGMVGRISEQLREDVETMLVSIVNRDVPMLAMIIKRIGKCPSDLNESALHGDIADYVGQYSTQVLSQFDMSAALSDFVEMVRRYNILLPAEASLLIKTLISLEGTARLLNPEFSLMEIMKPYQRILTLRRLSPSRQARKMQRFYMQLEQLADGLPQRINHILEQVQTGRFDIHLDHRRLGPTVNRLVLGMLTSALFLGSSWMLASAVPPLLFPEQGPLGIRDLSVFGLFGMLCSVMLGLRLVWAIRKSGNLDQQDK
ncbi:MAG: AarF/UbiB family protein [Planctomycetota bacterium]|nr:AarF/UbiB family protein [Planctomycetota bacterium]